MFPTLKNIFEKNALLISLLLAFILRTTAAIFNFGPAAYDDSQNILDPALQLLFGRHDIEVPAERFFSLPYLFYLFMKPISLLGVDRADYLVSSGYFFIGLLSLFQILGIYKLAGLYLNRKWQNLITLSSSVYALSPFYATRVELDGLAMIPMTWALYFISKKEPLLSSRVWGGFFLALSVYLKFSIAPVFFVLAGYLFIKDEKKFQGLMGISAGGAIVLFLMVTEEIIVGRSPLSTVFSYLDYNYTHHVGSQSYGTMPWYTYLAILAVYFIPPFSFPLLYAFIKGIKNSLLPALVLTIFVILYSIVPFKLDRYILPIIPAFFLITFRGLQELESNKLVQRSFYLFLIFSSLISILAATNGSQLANIKGTIELGQLKKQHRILYKIDPFWHSFYGIQNKYPERLSEIEDLKNSLQQKRSQEVYVLSFLSIPENELKLLSSNKIQCIEKNRFYPSYAEALIIKLNPQFNNRRRETVLYLCNP